jgi:hypothetical protein
MQLFRPGGTATIRFTAFSLNSWLYFLCFRLWDISRSPFENCPLVYLFQFWGAVQPRIVLKIRRLSPDLPGLIALRRLPETAFLGSDLGQVSSQAMDSPKRPIELAELTLRVRVRRLRFF